MALKPKSVKDINIDLCLMGMSKVARESMSVDLYKLSSRCLKLNDMELNRILIRLGLCVEV